MLRTTIIWLFFIAASFCQAQAQLHQYVGEENLERDPSVAVLRDGGFVMGGITEDAARNVKGLLYKFNTAGKLVWTNEISGPKEYYLFEVMQLSSGDVLVAGTIADEAEGERDIVLHRQSLSGEIISSWRYKNPGSDHIVSCIELPNGDIVFSGSVEKLRGILVCRVSRSGTILWQKVYKHNSSTWGTNLALSAQNEILVVGSFYNGPFGLHDAFLMALDQQGNQAWSKVYGSDNNDSFHNIAVNNTGEVLMGGNTWSWGNGANETFLVKLSKTAELQWSKVIRAHPSGNRTFQVVSNGARGFLGIANHSLNKGNCGAYIFGINNNGKMTFDHSFGGNAQTSLRDLCIWNAQYLAVGATTDFGAGDRDFYMVTGATNGKDPACQTMNNEIKAREVKTKVLNYTFKEGESSLEKVEWTPMITSASQKLKEICDPPKSPEEEKQEDLADQNEPPAKKGSSKTVTSNKTDLDQIDLTFSDNKIPDKLGDRKVETSKTMVVDRETVELTVWDNNKVDGDTISLYINGTWVLRNYALKKRKKKVIVKLTKDANNYLVLFAHNEGKQPPNTAALEVRCGKNFRRRVGLTSNMKKSGAVRFIY